MTIIHLAKKAHKSNQDQHCICVDIPVPAAGHEGGVVRGLHPPTSLHDEEY